MFDDEDIRIAGDKPSQSINNTSNYPQNSLDFQTDRMNGNIDKAKLFGKEIADELISNCTENIISLDENDSDEAIKAQRILLLSFTATVSFELACPDTVTSNMAQNTFFDRLQAVSPDIYKNSCDTGAFSFYFLAYRSGNDSARRIGQTFAMICGHDGDPIYQELGETLHCWFKGLILEKAAKQDFIYKKA